MRFLIGLAGVLVFSAAPALAHVTANPNAGMAGSYFETKFRVSHGCDGSDTVEVRVTLPEGMVVVKPQAKPGWRVEIKKSTLETPVPAGHGRMADEQVDEVIWRGGVLADSQYDEFGLLMKLPEKQGETLWFPVRQVCEKGEANWAEIPVEGQAWHDVPHPAPFVKLEAKTGHHGH